MQQPLPFTVLKPTTIKIMAQPHSWPLQQPLPFTVLKHNTLNQSRGGELQSLQQPLPFTVLKLTQNSNNIWNFEFLVATALTVYGIETIFLRLQAH